MGYNFCSDNTTPMTPEVLDAIIKANQQAAMPYGNDDWTRALEKRFTEVFECDCTVYPVATGTAANGLALAQVTPPFGAIFCHKDAHILVDECGAPEFFSGGARLVPLEGQHGKLHAGALAQALTSWERTIHNMAPAAISLTQLTEWGTAYAPVEISDLAAVAKAHDMVVHMDGARFANAVAGLGCRPSDITWRAGVDVLSFGASKNGCMGAEAVVFFNKELAQDFGYRRKRSGHLWSKGRFLSAQLEAYLTDNRWLTWAAHANKMASLLADGLATLEGVNFITKPDGNEIYLDMPTAMNKRLQDSGFSFYEMPIQGRKAQRLVTAWNTPVTAVEEFITAARQLMTKP